MHHATKEATDCPLSMLVCLTFGSLVVVAAVITLLAWLSGRL